MKSSERSEVPEEIVHALEHLGIERRKLRVFRSLWAGYGTLFRGELPSGERVIVKIVVASAPGKDDFGHRRKIESYRVEGRYYTRYPAIADRFGAECYAALSSGESSLLVLRDLADLGYDASPGSSDPRSTRAILDLLASFHATTLGKEPALLWPIGTYYHLATRPREHATMPRGRLKEAAVALDAKLRGARHVCWVHGDAKPENFCLSPEGTAKAVDFQYVGGGPGIVDVAYFLSSVVPSNAPIDHAETLLDEYFTLLRRHLAETGLEDDAIGRLEVEWRALHPIAWADLYRFLAGWAPGGYDEERLAATFIERALRTLE